MESASHSHPLVKLSVNKLSAVKALNKDFDVEGLAISLMYHKLREQPYRTLRTGMRRDSESSSLSVSKENPASEIVVMLMEVSHWNL